MQVPLSAADIARCFGVSRQRVYQLRHEHADFPAPVGKVGVILVWRSSDVARWAAKHGRKVAE